jgi:hypothetical protein
MQVKIYILFCLVCCLACNKTSEEKIENADSEIKSENIDNNVNSETEFDKTKWLAKDDHHYPYRNELLEELLSSHTLDSLKKDEIIDLLGEPIRIDNNHLFYTIAQKRLGFWPLHTKTLVIKLTEEESVEWIRVHE